MTWTIETPQGRAQLLDGTYLIGRAPGCHIALSDMTVSGQHARLQIRATRATLCDLGSRNGTFVNGQRLGVNSPTDLPDGVSVRIGTVPLVLQRSPDATGQRPAPAQQRQPSRAAGVGARPYAPPVQERHMGPSRGPAVGPSIQAPPRATQLPVPPDYVVRLVTSSSFPRSIWLSAGTMLVALFLPWVDVGFQLDYVTLWRLASGLGGVARALGSEASTWPLALPGLATLAAIAASVAAFTSPHNSPGLAAGAGGLGTIGAVAVFAAFASSMGFDLTAVLGIGFYVFSLGSVALLAVGGAGIWCRQFGYMNG